MLCCRFMDLDEEIEKKEGRSIAEIFAADGEEAFRDIEEESLGIILSGEQRCRGWHGPRLLLTFRKLDVTNRSDIFVLRVKSVIFVRDLF